MAIFESFRYLQSMCAELKSQHLTLRPFQVTDVDLAIEMFTDPAVMTFWGSVKSAAQVRADMDDWTKRGGNGAIGVWCIANSVTQEKLGSVFLLPMPIVEEDTDWGQVIEDAMPYGDVEIGFILKQAAWGKGYATEACRRLLRFAFEETPLEEVVATLYDEHEVSKRVLEKSGLTYRGRRRAYGDDCPDWRITKAEWLKQSAL